MRGQLLTSPCKFEQILRILVCSDYSKNLSNRNSKNIGSNLKIAEITSQFPIPRSASFSSSEICSVL